jgi:hypothetical protein
LRISDLAFEGQRHVDPDGQEDHGAAREEDQRAQHPPLPAGQAATDGDLEKFLAQYAPGIRKYRFPGTLASEGLEHNRKIYTKAFASYPDLNVEIVDLIAMDDIVVVRDRVTGRPDGKVSDEITVYEVKDGLITNIVYVKQSVR